MDHVRPPNHEPVAHRIAAEARDVSYMPGSGGMLTVLDRQTAIVHLSYKHTHFTTCGVYRINRRDGKVFKRMKTAPNCLACITYAARQ